MTRGYENIIIGATELGVPGTKRNTALIRAINERVSGYIYNDDGDVDKIAQALQQTGQDIICVDVANLEDPNALASALGILSDQGHYDTQLLRERHPYIVVRNLDLLLSNSKDIQKGSLTDQIVQVINIGERCAGGCMISLAGNRFSDIQQYAGERLYWLHEFILNFGVSTVIR